MSKVWKEKLSSRKFMVTLAGVITVIANDYFGIGFEKETILSVVGLMMSYVVGQGYVDGKEKGTK
jgi:uncharacterized membrane protein